MGDSKWSLGVGGRVDVCWSHLSLCSCDKLVMYCVSQNDHWSQSSAACDPEQGHVGIGKILYWTTNN